MAKAFGNKVYTTAEGPEKVAACKKLGADVVIDYTKEDFFEVIKAETKKRLALWCWSDAQRSGCDSRFHRW